MRPMVLKEEGPTLHVADASKLTGVDRKWSRREERTSNFTVESGSLLSEGYNVVVTWRREPRQH